MNRIKKNWSILYSIVFGRKVSSYENCCSVVKFLKYSINGNRYISIDENYGRKIYSKLT